jgi:DNA-binding CsgD family transcriptional regulator
MCLLSLPEIREAFRVVGDCRDEGSDVFAWNQVLIHHLHSMFNSVFTASFILTLPLDEIRLIDAEMFCERWEYPKYRPRWAEIYAAGHLPQLPTVGKFFEGFAGGRTARRCDLIDDESWQSSQELLEFRSSCAQDDILMSAYTVPGKQQLHCLTINLPTGEQRFTELQCAQVQLIHEEIVPLMGTRLSLSSKAPFRMLPPRLKQVFELLMEGKSEPQIGDRLMISKHTVHDYVMQIYRRFHVRSRTELVATAYQMGWKK